jgi:hypothetical protein
VRLRGRGDVRTPVSPGALGARRRACPSGSTTSSTAIICRGSWAGMWQGASHPPLWLTLAVSSPSSAGSRRVCHARSTWSQVGRGPRTVVAPPRRALSARRASGVPASPPRWWMSLWRLPATAGRAARRTGRRIRGRWLCTRHSGRCCRAWRAAGGTTARSISLDQPYARRRPGCHRLRCAFLGDLHDGLGQPWPVIVQTGGTTLAATSAALTGQDAGCASPTFRAALHLWIDRAGACGYQRTGICGAPDVCAARGVREHARAPSWSGRGRGRVKLRPLRPRSGGERGAVTLAPLRPRRRGEWS